VANTKDYKKDIGLQSQNLGFEIGWIQGGFLLVPSLIMRYVRNIRSSPIIKNVNPLCCHDHTDITLICLFPYPYGFCNPVRIHGMKINGMI